MQKLMTVQSVHPNPDSYAGVVATLADVSRHPNSMGFTSQLRTSDPDLTECLKEGAMVYLTIKDAVR